jgi:hypothetical protein
MSIARKFTYNKRSGGSEIGKKKSEIGKEVGRKNDLDKMNFKYNVAISCAL